MDSFQSVPAFLLMLLISVFEGPPLWVVSAAIGLTTWPGTARLVKYVFTESASSTTVESARAVGAGFFRIFKNYLLREAVQPLGVLATQQISLHILYEGALSFLGLGVQPPETSLGVLALEGWRHFESRPSEIFVPALVLFVIALVLSELGRWLAARRAFPICADERA